MTRILSAILLICLLSKTGSAQITYLPQGSKEVHLLNRLETFSGHFSDRLFLSDPMVSREDLATYLQDEKSNFYHSTRNNIDNFNINRALLLSSEWSDMPGMSMASRHPVFNTFYTTPASFYQLNRPGFFLSLNPVLSFDATYEKYSGADPSMLFNAAEGIELRGRIKNRVGFYFMGTHHYEEPVHYQQQWIDRWEAFPGAGDFHRTTTGGYEYLRFRGYLNVALIKHNLSLNVGYGQHFIGDGIRSLFLSDFSEASTFVSLDTKIWKLHYRNIYLRLTPQSFSGQPPMKGHKYATIHYLSVNVRPWLNIGAFESVTLDRSGGFPVAYMNPIIFYRAIERSQGSPDKVAVGLSAKAIVLRRLNLYSQFLLNEFTAKQFFNNDGYWANKWGLQMGAKYFEAFGIPNLDLQVEMNLVRPYTYTHSLRNNAISNFTHYNQALAHPLGAGLEEIIGKAVFQPLPLLTVTATAMYYRQGVDTGMTNLGNNIFKDYRTRSENKGVTLVNGPRGDCLLFDIEGVFEIRPRLFLELGGTYRQYEAPEAGIPMNKDLYFHAGFRLNINKPLRAF